MSLMKGDKAMTNGTASNKVLDAPVHLATMAANLETDVGEIKSIWVMQRDDALVGKPVCELSSINLGFILMSFYCR
jgi:hypothetical protein